MKKFICGSQLGMSLVELMVASGLTSIIFAGVTALYSNAAKHTAIATNRLTAQQESERLITFISNQFHKISPYIDYIIPPIRDITNLADPTLWTNRKNYKMGPASSGTAIGSEVIIRQGCRTINASNTVGNLRGRDALPAIDNTTQEFFDCPGNCTNPKQRPFVQITTQAGNIVEFPGGSAGSVIFGMKLCAYRTHSTFLSYDATYTNYSYVFTALTAWDGGRDLPFQWEAASTYLTQRSSKSVAITQ